MDVLRAHIALADVRADLRGTARQAAASLRAASRVNTALQERIKHLEQQLLDQRLAEGELHATVERLRFELVSPMSSAAWRSGTVMRAAGGWLRSLRHVALRAGRAFRRLAAWHPVQPAGGDHLPVVLPEQRSEPTPVVAAAPPLAAHHAGILASGVFDSAYYLLTNQDVAASAIDPLQHYLDYGHKEGREPNEMFDSAWYLRENDDVASIGMNPLHHFALFGAFEGRDPHPDFSIRDYVQTLPEPIPPDVNPLAHYLRQAGRERRFVFSPAARYRDRVGREYLAMANQRPELIRHVAVMTYRPKFLVLVEASDADEAFQSVVSQLYPAAAVYRTRPELVSALATLVAADVYVLWLQDGDLLAEQALYAFASALNADPSLDVLYSDEDSIGSEGRQDPFFKPDWSPDLLEALDYVSGCACLRATLVRSVLADTVSRYDTVLRVTERTSAVGHIRQTLCHRRRGAVDPVPPWRSALDKAALTGRLQRTNRSGTVVQVANDRPVYQVAPDLLDKPLVSVVIPTAGKIADIDGREIDLIVNCIDTVLARSTYTNLEFIVVDNDDFDRRRLAHVTTVPIRHVTYRDPVFNVARKINLGAGVATGPVLLLLNDDIEPITPGWIEAMLGHLQKPHVGVVGAKLFFSDMTVQHQGVVLNDGTPDHVRRWVPPDDLGYFYSSRTARNYLAVTGACMLTPAAAFSQVGGYTELLGVSYNDVDYCLKLREQGATAVVEPTAELLHFESKSRVGGLDLAEQRWFHARWSAISTDPYYNENELTIVPSSYEVHHNARRL